MARWKAIPVAGLAALIVGTALFSTQYRTASAAPSAGTYVDAHDTALVEQGAS